MLPKEVVSPGFEKLKSMLGSTPAEVETKELGLDGCEAMTLLVANDVTGPGDDMP
jgi:hypothetical protein|tara:strand:+ start:7186 stop:7350 length:165 start_codon:yes stop_codon:yes gene_type:complete